MNAASNDANSTSMRNNAPVTMDPPLPARGQPDRADDFGKEATLGCHPIRCVCWGSAIPLLGELFWRGGPADGGIPSVDGHRPGGSRRERRGQAHGDIHRDAPDAAGVALPDGGVPGGGTLLTARRSS